MVYICLYSSYIFILFILCLYSLFIKKESLISLIERVYQNLNCMSTKSTVPDNCQFLSYVFIDQINTDARN